MSFFAALAASQPVPPVISASAVSSTSIQVNLVTSASEPTYGIGSYSVYYSTVGATGPWNLIVANIPYTSFPYLWNAALAGTSYWMMATGNDNSQNQKASAPSNTPNVTTAGGSTSLPYPITQLTFYPNGAGITNTAFQQLCAKVNYVQFIPQAQGAYPGGATNSSVFLAIKNYASSLYPGHTVYTGIYQIDNGWFQSTGTSGATETLKINQCNNNLGWRLQQTPGTYPSGTTSGTLGETNTGYLTNNDTSGCPSYTFTNVGGVNSASTIKGAAVNLTEYLAWYEIQCWVNGNASALGAGFTEPANPYCDFVQRDNQYLYPRWDGYYASNSTSYARSNDYGGANPAQSIVVRGLMSTGAKQARAMYNIVPTALASGKPLMFCGNSDALVYYNNSSCPATFDADKLGVYNMTNSEAPIGQHYSSPATSNTFAGLLLACMVNEACTSGNDPSKNIWNMEGRGNGTWGNWQVAGVPTGFFVQADWQSARYQNGLIQLLRWIAGAAVQTAGNAWQFDEWDSGTNTPGWLGAPSGSRQINTSTGAYVPFNAASSLAWNTYGIITVPFANGNVYIFPAATNDVTTGLTATTLPTAALQNGGGHHITYTVTPSGSVPSGVTSGAAFTSLFINPRDAIFTAN